MRMSEYLNQIAPNTAKKFFSDIMYNYGVGVKEFEEKSLLARLVEIRRFFGYSMTINPDVSEKDMQDDIKFMFEDFELINLKYPDGVPDVMKRLKEMPNKEKTEYIEKHYRRQINMSLCHALVKGGKLKTISLKDALIARVLSQIEQMSAVEAQKALAEEEFWNNIIKNFNPEEIPPF
jgi:hypothetical protein